MSKGAGWDLTSTSSLQGAALGFFTVPPDVQAAIDEMERAS